MGDFSLVVLVLTGAMNDGRKDLELWEEWHGHKEEQESSKQVKSGGESC